MPQRRRGKAPISVVRPGTGRAQSQKVGRKFTMRTCVIILALGSALAAAEHWRPAPGRAAVADKSSSARDPSAAAGAIPVTVAAARKGDIPVYVSGLGSVTAFYTVTVKTRVDGQLVRVAFREGDLVRQGDLLAEIDPRPFQVQLEQAEGVLARDQALLENARRDLQRYRTLIVEDAVPQQQVDTQDATVAQLAGTVQSDRADVANARLQLTYSRITAPITGRVGLRLVDPGNMVHAADANGLLVITEVQPITVLFSIPQDWLPQVLEKLRTGQRLQVDAFNRDGTSKLASGRLLSVDNQIDPTTGTARLKALFDNANQALFPNQFVNARLLLDTERDQVLVPAAAIRRGPQGSFVYVAGDDAVVHAQPVSVGITQGDQTAIASGILAGAHVVVDGMDQLRDGTRVQFRR
jgi:multidrug efflux system membrane fusion protein